MRGAVIAIGVATFIALDVTAAFALASDARAALTSDARPADVSTRASDAPSAILAQRRPGGWTQPAPTPRPGPAAPPATVTGACTVTGYGIRRTCTDGLTFQDCLSVAYRVQGVADWQQGQSCKD